MCFLVKIGVECCRNFTNDFSCERLQLGVNWRYRSGDLFPRNREIFHLLVGIRVAGMIEIVEDLC